MKIGPWKGILFPVRNTEWDWKIYLHEWLEFKYGVHGGKYSILGAFAYTNLPLRINHSWIVIPFSSHGSAMVFCDVLAG